MKSWDLGVRRPRKGSGQCQKLQRGQSQDGKAPSELGSQGPPCLWWGGFHGSVRGGSQKLESEGEESLGREGKERDKVPLEV